jgi:methionine synthase II (cobalamin-independent)
VGSLIRPQELCDARQAHLAGTMPAAELHALEDRLIREAVAMQERVGLQAITDGEFRRTSFREVLFERIDGFSKERVETDFSFSYADGSTRRATRFRRSSRACGAREAWRRVTLGSSRRRPGPRPRSCCRRRH